MPDDVLSALTDEDRAWLREHGWKEPPPAGSRELVRLSGCAVWVRGLTFQEWTENPSPLRRIALALCTPSGEPMFDDCSVVAFDFPSNDADKLLETARRLSGFA